MKKRNTTVAILAADQYEDLELWYPLLRFREAGATVDVVSHEASVTYHSKHGYPIKSGVAAKNVSPEHYDAIVIPGGWAPDYLRRSADIVTLVRESYEKGAIIAAICHGGSLLCSAGILSARQVTSFFSIKHDMMNAGAVWTDAEVINDQRIVTSRTPDDLPAFVRTLIAELNL